jgi:hypothetical protein
MLQRRRAAAAVALLCWFYAPLRLSVSVLAPRAHHVPAATQPLPAPHAGHGMLEVILLRLQMSSEAALTGHANVHWHLAYAQEEDHERLCANGEHNHCRSAGYLSQADAFVGALLELRDQLRASVHQLARCNARYRTSGEICRQAEFAWELARAHPNPNLNLSPT